MMRYWKWALNFYIWPAVWFIFTFGCRCSICLKVYLIFEFSSDPIYRIYCLSSWANLELDILYYEIRICSMKTPNIWRFHTANLYVGVVELIWAKIGKEWDTLEQDTLIFKGHIWLEDSSLVACNSASNDVGVLSLNSRPSDSTSTIRLQGCSRVSYIW